MADTGYIVVLCTCDSVEVAESIARGLVEQRLAACVNILPGGRSIYRWQGKVEDSSELLLLIKTRNGLFDDVRAAVTALHSYNLPELIALPIVQGSEAYLSWLGEHLTGAGAGEF